ncbi:Uncharacterized membrane protein YidH, DUF202 family [Brevibacterium siliguriense]|uniref:Uncharacterized membrane protein YidH, DUF202 family n=1 Tax=Brevibacterium siliguriense TaxID=1136497 RepID=A0A1H1WAP4_9MICO|nr:DUF202 domain-containing protein [Brevibacterium siliguriense]SDS93496.1 Uncharacterized membrane protein YidH, DUF202 family [Brevibacterium siliguriense]
MPTRSPRPQPHDDPALQPERTVQSWLRTSLTLTVVSLVFMRYINVFQGWSVAIFVVCLGMAIVAIAMQVRRYRLGSASIRIERGRPTPWAVIFLTTSVCLIAVLSIASVIKISLL